MSAPASLLDRFVLGLDEAERPRVLANAAFGDALGAMVAAARAAWPSLALGPEAFVEYLAPRWRAARAETGDAAKDGAASLRALREGDLYLACACASGDPAALAAFEARYAAEIEAALRRLRLGRADIDEAQQLLRTLLFVGAGAGSEAAAPKIEDYGGRGDLGGWLRVVVIRIGLRVLRKNKDQARAEVGEEAIGGHPAEGDDPELAFLKRTYGAAFDEALRHAFASLPVRARLLLKQYFGHGLTVDELGALHRVGRSTAARWVTAAREDLVAATREALMDRLALGRPEVASLLRLIDSQLASKVAELVRTPSAVRTPPEK